MKLEKSVELGGVFKVQIYSMILLNTRCMDEKYYIGMIFLFIIVTPGILIDLDPIAHGIMFVLILYIFDYREAFQNIDSECYEDSDCLKDPAEGTTYHCSSDERCGCFKGKCKLKRLALCIENNDCDSGKCETLGEHKRCM